MGEDDHRPGLPGRIFLTADPLTVPVATMVLTDPLAEEEYGKGHEIPATHRAEPAPSPGKPAVKEGPGRAIMGPDPGGHRQAIGVAAATPRPPA